MKKIIFLAWLIMFAPPAKADFVLNSAILEFNKDKPPQQDVEVVSRSDKNDYVVAEISEVLSPGLADERRTVITNPLNSRLLVTPNKTVLAAGGRKTIRFVLLKPLDDKEHIYRVAIKPVIKGLDNQSIVGLKVLIGYEVLVILRPLQPNPSYNAIRNGNRFTAANTGNTNILFQNGQQCGDTATCKVPPVLRIYPGQTGSVDLPFGTKVIYSVWDGATSSEKEF